MVEEAATDVIARQQAQGVAEPWTDPGFIDAIAELQRQRRLQAANLPGTAQFHDRSAVCTAALADYLGHPVSAGLRRELQRIETAAVFERRVFFIRHLGFVVPTAARRISFADALRFEQVHEATYRRYGYQLVPIAPGPLANRVAAIKAALD